MSVLLKSSWSLGPSDNFDFWEAIAPNDGANLPPNDQRVDPDEFPIEEAFAASADEWYTLAMEMVEDNTASLAHAPSVAPNASDFGLMLAWSRLVDQWADSPDRILIICDDPWLFRHLSQRPGVEPGQAPSLWPRLIFCVCRGFAARCRVAIKMMVYSIWLRRQRRKVGAPGKSYIVVFGHPASSPDGSDAYFGDLMKRFPGLLRMIHVDSDPARFRSLLVDDRTTPLRAWGNPLSALHRLPWARWRPSEKLKQGPYGWLVRRAAALEGSTGQGAMGCWQQICQESWLKKARPKTVIWPWENHGWERALVSSAKAFKTHAIGHQHSVIGEQFNISGRVVGGRAQEVPDQIICNGPSGLDQLLKSGIEKSRLVDGGTFRFSPPVKSNYDPAGKIFIAVPFDQFVADQMVEAARPLARKGFQFIVKSHPIFGFAFDEEEGLQATDNSLENHSAISAVIYAATTVGLEAVIAGIPTFRFRPRGRVALDIMPNNVDIPWVSFRTLEAALSQPMNPMKTPWDRIFSRITPAVWQSACG